MAKTRERRLVIKLRKQGKSYSEIKKLIHVSKSSLSLWLRDIPLGETQIARIRSLKSQAVERYRETMRLKRDNRIKGYYEYQKKLFTPLTERELLIAGIFLYWGEGNKASRGNTSINNTDPEMIKFCLYWIVNILKIPKEKIRIQLHLYNDMNIEEEIQYWVNELGISRNQLNKPYIKTSKKIDIDQKGYGHGTCCLTYSNTVLKENILMAIKAISDFYGQKLRSI